MEEIEFNPTIRERYGRDLLHLYVEQGSNNAQKAAKRYGQLANAYDRLGKNKEKKNMETKRVQFDRKSTRYREKLPIWELEAVKRALRDEPNDYKIGRLLELDRRAVLEVKSVLLEKAPVAQEKDLDGGIVTLTNKQGEILVDYVVEDEVTLMRARLDSPKEPNIKIVQHSHYHVSVNEGNVSREWLEAESARDEADKKAVLKAVKWKTYKQARLSPRDAEAEGITLHHGTGSREMLKLVQDAAARNQQNLESGIQVQDGTQQNRPRR